MQSDSSSRLVTYTLFTDTTGATKVERSDVPWSELVNKVQNAASYSTKQECPLISLAEYGDESTEKGSLRHAANIRRVFGVELDYDDEAMSLDEAADRLRAANIGACLYTSASHKPDAPHWRVLAPLENPASPDQRAGFVGRLNRILGGVASRESFALSQSFFIGKVDGAEYKTAVTGGRCVDEAVDIEPLLFMSKGNDDASQRDLTTDSELRAAFERGEGRYQAMLKLSSRWAARGMEEDDIVASLSGLFGDTSSLNADGIDLRERIPGISKSACNKFGETRRGGSVSVSEEADNQALIGNHIQLTWGESVELPKALSDDDLAKRFSLRYAGKFLYCEELGRWYQWTGTHWAYDTTRAVFDAARESSRLDLADALAVDLTNSQRRALRTRFGSAATINAIVRLASSDRRHAVRVNELDADRWLINTPGGIVDLRTGVIRPHDPALRVTKITAAAPATECLEFQRSLEKSIPAVDVREFFRRFAGSAMTGIVADHKTLVMFGSGANGKSLITNAIRHALGDYAVTLQSEVLMESHHDRHPTEIAVLRGARLALCSEVDSGRRWNEARLKRLSGGDPITARLIAGDPFEFQPTHKFIVTANSKPGLRTLDEATRRRILLVEFGVTIPESERDQDLPEKLKSEAAGIVGWMIAGCLDWQADGLRPPAAVLEATNTYLDREDSIGEWIRERCRPGGQSSLSTLHASYRFWAEECGLPIIGRNTFGDQLEARGITRTQIRPKVWEFVGISPIQRLDARNVP
jgi:P4 family phage/plasmid primase-like protien